MKIKIRKYKNIIRFIESIRDEDIELRYIPVMIWRKNKKILTKYYIDKNKKIYKVEQSIFKR